MDEEGRLLKRLCCALLALLLLAGACSAQAQERGEIAVYAAQSAISRQKAAQLTALCQRAFPQAEFTLVTAGDLRGLVLADSAPDIALCAPEEAAVWAREGMLVPLMGAIADGEQMAEAVLSACVQAESAFMAPMSAQFKQMAVNRRLLDKLDMGAMLDEMEYPVWLPMQMLQVLDECALSGITGAEVWLPEGRAGEAIAALVQSIYSGSLLSEDGETVLADSGAMIAGVSWLQDMLDAELLALADSREAALARFLDGETALFFDWTNEDAQALRLAESNLEVCALPYPSSSGMPVRAFSLCGAAAFASGDEAKDALLREVIAFMAGDAQAQLVLGERGVCEDGAIWLPRISVTGRGGALYALFEQALCAVMRDGLAPETAMRAVQAAGEGIWDGE